MFFYYIQCEKLNYGKCLFSKKDLKNWVNFETGKRKCLQHAYFKSLALVVFLMFFVAKLPIQ